MIDPKWLNKNGGIKNLGVPPEIKTQWFIETATELHNGKYDYSKAVYTRSRDKLEIICLEEGHGSFFQTPNNHLSNKHGCPSCSKNLKMSTDMFVSRAIKLHGDKFDYSRVVYTNIDTSVFIRCKTCSTVFSQTPDKHLNRGDGCTVCSNTNRRKTLEQFIEESKAIHGASAYSYDRAVYTLCTEEVTLGCNSCGTYFNQIAGSHTRHGAGCPTCAGKIYTTLYLLKCLDTGLTKIGITKHLERRMGQIGNMFCIAAFKLGNPKAKEAELHARLSSVRTNHPRGKELGGYTEFFDLTKEQIESIKEELLREVMDADQQILG